jgi:3'(2'), 5'-bisphosphate nucleotidase
LIENNSSTLGFVTVPVKGLIYYGGKKFGSKLINQDKKISQVKYKKVSGVCRVVASKSHLNKETKEFINNIKGKVELIQAGSSLKFIKIAEGLADIYPRLGPTSEWDTAAAHAILEGAGGNVLQLNGKDIIYGKENILNPYFIASGAKNRLNL